MKVSYEEAIEVMAEMVAEEYEFGSMAYNSEGIELIAKMFGYYEIDVLNDINAAIRDNK